MPSLDLKLSARAGALADRIVADALDPENGVAGANLALRTLDAIDPLVEVSESVSTGVELGQRLMAGENVSFKELERVFGPEAQEAFPAALPA